MKKIIFTAILLLFSFSLRAQGDNSFIIGFGSSSNTVKISKRSSVDTQYGPYMEAPDFDAKSNISISYLRKMSDWDDRLYLGVDFTMFLNNGSSNEEQRNTLMDGSYTILKDKSNLYSYTLMMLVNYELLRLNGFELTAQLGAGLMFNTLDLDINNTFYSPQGNVRGFVDVSGLETSGTEAARAGLIGSYNLFDRLAIAVGAYYTYTGKTTHNNVAGSDIDYRFKNNGTVSYNVHLIWRT